MSIDHILRGLSRLDVDPNLHHLDRNLINAAAQIMKSQAATIANFKGHLGVDQRPVNYTHVDVYCKTQCDDPTSGRWSRFGAHNVQDWHLWRPSFVPDDSVIARSEEMRQQLGVTDKVDGFYRLLEEDGES